MSRAPSGNRVGDTPWEAWHALLQVFFISPKLIVADQPRYRRRFGNRHAPAYQRLKRSSPPLNVAGMKA